MTGNTRFFPVHVPYIANNYRLFSLFIMFWKLLFSSKLFMAYRSYVQSSSCSPPNLSSSFFTGFSHLHLIWYASVPKLLYSVAFLKVRNFPTAVFFFISGHLLFSISSHHIGLSGHFTTDGIRSLHPRIGSSCIFF